MLTDRPTSPFSRLLLVAALTTLVACDSDSGARGNRLGASGESPGFTVATDGATAVVGVARGPAAIYHRGPDGWDAAAKPEADDLDSFGRAVAVDQDLAALGAYTEGGTTEDPEGAVYVHTRVGRQWPLATRLPNPDPTAYEAFGRGVAVSDGRVFVGARAADAPPGTHRERDVVFVYERDGTGWGITGRLSSPPGVSAFGAPLAADAGLLVVGATRGDIRTEAGTAFVYRRTGAGWALEAELVNPTPPDPADPFGGDAFGLSLALDGDRAVVGDQGAVVGGARTAGAAHVFERGDGSWGPVARLVHPEPGQRFFAHAVALDGDRAVVGSEFEDGGRGAVYTFVQSGGAWPLADRLSVDGAYTFGTALSAEGGALLVGAPYDRVGNGTGAAYAFRWAGTTWRPD